MFCQTCNGVGRNTSGRYNNWCMACGGTGLASDANRYANPQGHLYHADKYMEGDNQVCVHCGQSALNHPQRLA